MGEPEAASRAGREARALRARVAAVWRPFVEFFVRKGALLVLLFILLHKIGDTLANLTFRLLFDDLGFTNDEIALYDVGVGFWAYLVGIFVGGVLYAQLGMKRSVLISLILMAVSNFSFALLAAAGHTNSGMAGAIGFENFASGIGGVCRRRLFLGAVRPALHRRAICADLGGGEHRRAVPHRHHGGRADRRHGLCQLLPADHRRGCARDPPVLVMMRTGLVDSLSAPPARGRGDVRAGAAGSGAPRGNDPLPGDHRAAGLLHRRTSFAGRPDFLDHGPDFSAAGERDGLFFCRNPAIPAAQPARPRGTADNHPEARSRARTARGAEAARYRRHHGQPHSARRRHDRARPACSRRSSFTSAGRGRAPTSGPARSSPAGCSSTTSRARLCR